MNISINEIEILKLIISALNPILLLVLGIWISKKLEKIKFDFQKEKTWTEKWADRFLNNSSEFNTCITTLITSLFAVAEVEKEKSSGWENKIQDESKLIVDLMYRLRVLDWELQIFIQFLPEHGESLQKAQKLLSAKVAELISKKHGNLEEIRILQFEYNKLVRSSHSELLRLNK